MKNFIHLAVMLLVFCSISNAQDAGWNTKKLRDCDLLFHIPPTSNAITKVTTGVDQQEIDHVGIFFWHDGQPQIIEATYDGVVASPIDSVLTESGSWLVGRVKGKIDRTKTLENALSHVGKPYDFTFQRDDQEIYCSELVEISYVYKNGNQIFKSIPMSFHDESGTILPYWVDFYSRRGMDVPEGMPGSNPGDISRNKKVKIVLKFEKRGGSQQVKIK